MAGKVVTYVLRGDIKDLQAKMVAAGKSIGHTADTMSAADAKSAKFRKGLTSVGDTAGKIGLAAGVGLGIAIAASARFDKAMSGVKAATHAGAASMDVLREAALQAGQDTMFSATQAADGIEQLAKAGVSTADILNGGLNGALSLAAAGELDVGDAAEIAATALTQFKLEGKDVGHVADLLAAGAGKAQGEVSDFGMALKQGGLIAAQTGLSIEETTGALGAFASAGLIGSDAGTSLKTMLQSLTPSSEKAQGAMDSLGISAYDSQGQFIGLEKWAGELRKGLSGLSDEQRNATLKTIFGSDAVRAASIIYEQGADGIGKWISKVDDAGYAADTAAMKTDNLAGDWERLTGSIETALIGVGDSSQGPLRQLVQGLENVVNKFNELPDATKGTTAALLGITAVTGGALWLGAAVVGKIAATRVALTELGVSSTATKGALLGVGRAASIAAGAFVGLAIVDKVQSGTDKLLPGLQELSKALDGLGAGTTGSLPKQFDDLANSVERLANPNMAQHLQDNISSAIGGIGGGSELKNARSEIESLDAALTNLVATGGAPAAKAAFEGMADSADLSKSQIADLTRLLPSYKDAMAGAGTATKRTDGATEDLGGTMKGVTALTKEQAKALDEAKKAARATADSFVGLGDKLDDSKVSLNQWIADMAKGARALRNFRENSVEAAQKGLRDGLIQALQDAGQSGALRMEQLAHATKAQIRAANQAWQSGQREVGKYVDKFADVPPGVAKAMGAVNGFVSGTNRALNGIDDETVQLTLSAQASHVQQELADIHGFAVKKATGGPIHGPGTGTSDDIPAWLSNGEHVLTAAEVKAFGGHEAILRWRKAALKGALPDPRDLPKFAGGGPVMGINVRERGMASSLASVDAMFAAITAGISKEMSAKANKLLTSTSGALGMGGSLSAMELVRGQQFAKGEVGKPYIWGGVGPTGYDCSGFQSAVLNSAKGRNPYSRIGSTGSMPWPGSTPGPGRYSMGWFTGSPGHTAGNIGGLNVESAGGVGVRVGPSARGPLDPMFNRMMHYAEGGPVDPALARQSQMSQMTQSRNSTVNNYGGSFPSSFAVSGKLDANGYLVGTMRKVAREEVDAAQGYGDTLRRQGVKG